MELVGPWQASVADDDLRRTWLDDHADIGDWHGIAVPGHWRSTPAFAENDEALLYRTRFQADPPAPGERCWLRFEGVFYQGDVWLDGGYVGDTEGYFFPHVHEITSALAARTEHTLGVEVTCSPQRDRTAKRNITGVFQHWNSTDPDANPGGIWGPVTIERTGPVRIRHLRVICLDANETRAQVAFRAVLDAAVAGEVTLRSSVGDTVVSDQRRLASGENQVEWTVRVDEPELWWPHALGEPVLHDVTVEVIPHAEERAGDVADVAAFEEDSDDEVIAPPPGSEASHRLTRRIGLRQIHLKGWVLHVNGERLFLKGANLAPTRTALGEATDDDLRRDVTLAKEANLDFLRIHGHISRPALYEAADEAGMLLWQDFPLQWGYARTIRKQAQRQSREAVDLLGHHPSIAIWCGHNEPFALEIEPGDGEVGVFTGQGLAAQELPSWNKSVLDRSVKRTITKADRSRPVIAHSGVLPHPPQLDGTDSHLSFGWLYGDDRDLVGFARLFPRLVRFVTEFGAQAVPETADFCEPERWPDLDWERLRTRHGMQKDVFDARVPPADHPTFEAWRQATQAYQAELIRHHVETLRRLKYRPTGGFAQFFLADAGPGISFSVLDHERVPKAGYLALRDACRPVIVVADRLPEEPSPGDTHALDVHVINDLRQPVEEVTVDATLRWTGGDQRWRFGGTVDADAVIRVGTLPIEMPDAPGPVTLELRLSGDGVVDGPVIRMDHTQIVRR